eukprot:360565-Chlamydomonas_euryale.AAC.3
MRIVACPPTGLWPACHENCGLHAPPVGGFAIVQLTLLRVPAAKCGVVAAGHGGGSAAVQLPAAAAAACWQPPWSACLAAR